MNCFSFGSFKNHVQILRNQITHINNIIEFSESDLRGSLDNNKDLELENDDDNNELIKLDYQLARAINLIKALSIFDG